MVKTPFALSFHAKLRLSVMMNIVILLFARTFALLLINFTSLAQSVNTAAHGTANHRTDGVSFHSQNGTANSNFTTCSFSTGGGSHCTTGMIRVTVTSKNVKIDYHGPPDQLAVTQFNVEMLQANSDLTRRLVGSPNPITGSYSIYSSLCIPADPESARDVKTLQFLTHGDTLSSSYWDIAAGYSYIDAATAAGYATFSYDRIGVGKSEHPDPIQVVQGALSIEIAHALVTMLRSGQIGQQKFSHFVGVGHSAGSTVTQAVTTKYPRDFDAIMLTGTSIVPTYVPLTLAGFDFQMANQASPKFRGLPNGYMTQANAIGIQFAFFRYPNFDPKSKSHALEK